MGNAHEVFQRKCVELPFSLKLVHQTRMPMGRQMHKFADSPILFLRAKSDTWHIFLVEGACWSNCIGQILQDDVLVQAGVVQ